MKNTKNRSNQYERPMRCRNPTKCLSLLLFCCKRKHLFASIKFVLSMQTESASNIPYLLLATTIEWNPSNTVSHWRWNVEWTECCRAIGAHILSTTRETDRERERKKERALTRQALTLAIRSQNRHDSDTSSPLKRAYIRNRALFRLMFLFLFCTITMWKINSEILERIYMPATTCLTQQRVNAFWCWWPLAMWMRDGLSRRERLETCISAYACALVRASFHWSRFSFQLVQRFTQQPTYRMRWIVLRAQALQRQSFDAAPTSAVNNKLDRASALAAIPYRHYHHKESKQSHFKSNMSFIIFFIMFSHRFLGISQVLLTCLAEQILCIIMEFILFIYNIFSQLSSRYVLYIYMCFLHSIESVKTSTYSFI